MNTLRIAKLTFREAVRRKALYGAIALTLAFLVLYGWGTGLAVQELNEEFNEGAKKGAALIASQVGVDIRVLAIGQLFVAGLYAISNIASLLAIFMAAGTIAQEIDQGTLHSIVSKPIQRWQVVVGKWLGGAAMLAVYIILSSLATAAIVYVQSGYASSQLPLGITLLVARAALLYSATMIGSAILPTITTGIVMFIVFVVSNVVGLVEQAGNEVGIESLVRIGVAGSIVIPSDALWKMAAAAVQPPNPLLALGIPMMVGPLMVNFPPSIWMGLYGVAYMLAALGVATVIFSKRDL